MKWFHLGLFLVLCFTVSGCVTEEVLRESFEKGFYAGLDSTPVAEGETPLPPPMPAPEPGQDIGSFLWMLLAYVVGSVAKGGLRMALERVGTGKKK